MSEVDPLDLLETIREGLLVIDPDLTVRFANRSFCDTFAVTPEDTVGRKLYELGNGQWDIPELRSLIETIVPERETIEAFEVDRVFPSIGRRVMVLNARKVYRAGNDTNQVLVAIEDVTEQSPKLPWAGRLIREDRHAMKFRHCLNQDFLPFAIKLSREDADSRCIAAWSGKRVHQPLADHIFGNPQDRNCRCRLLRSANYCVPVDQNDVDMTFDQLRRKFWYQLNARPITAPIDRDVSADDEAKAAKFIEHRRKMRCVAWARGNAADTVGSPRFLRRRTERPSDRSASDKSENLAPPHASLPWPWCRC